MTSSINASVEVTGVATAKADINANWAAAKSEIEALQAGTGLGSNVVLNANLATMAQSTIKGRASGGGAGSPQDLTVAQTQTVLGLAGSSTDKAVVRFSGTGGGTQNSGVTIDDSNNVAFPALGRFSGSENVVSPSLGAVAAVELINTDAHGGVGGQLRFGKTAGSPYAMISSYLNDGTSPGSGYLAFGIKDSSSGTLRDTIWMVPGVIGTLLSADSPTNANALASASSNFSAVNIHGQQNFVGYSSTEYARTGGVTPTTIPFYGVADNNDTTTVSPPGATGAYLEVRGGNNGLALGAEIDAQNTSGTAPRTVSPNSMFGSGNAPVLYALWSQADGTKSVVTPKDASAWAGIIGGGDNGGSANKFQKGIVFSQNVIASVGGHMEAITFGASQELAWYASGGNVARLTSDGNGFTATCQSGSTLALSGLQSITAGTLVDQANALAITATQPSTPTATQSAVVVSVTGAGSAAFDQVSMLVKNNAGYTGSNSTYALGTTNASAGTGNSLVAAAGGDAISGNVGLSGFVSGTTAGLNVGVRGAAENGTTSVGLLGSAQKAKNSGTNIGVVGTAVNTGTSPVMVGGWFSLNQTTVPAVSAALIVDNGSQAVHIARFRDNGTDVVTIADGGTLQTTGKVGINISPSFMLDIKAPTDDGFRVTNAAGTQYRGWFLNASDTDGQLRLYHDSSTLGVQLSASGLSAFANGVSVGTTTLMTSTVALSNGAAANTGTLTNAPAAGNPTKWIPINDNGTTRYIPAW